MERKEDSIKTQSKSSSLLRGHSSPVLCLDVNEAKKLLFSGSEDKTARLWDLNTGKSIRCFCHCFNGEVSSVLFSKTSSEMVFISVGNQIFSFDLRKPEVLLKEPQYILSLNQDEVNQLAMKNNLLAACDDSGEIKVINVSETPSLSKTLRNGHKNICSCLAFHPNETIVASGGLDSSILLWDYSTGKIRYTFDMTQRMGINEQSPQIVNPPFVHSLDLSSRHLVAGLGNSSIVLFDLTSKRQTHLLQWHTSSISQVLFPSFEPLHHIVSGSNDVSNPSIAVWSLPTLTDETLPKNKKKKQYIDPVTVEKPETQILHKEKINWITSTATINLNANLFVADQTNSISAYLIE